jgi:D-alanine-D-alanine ligase-like ATP-grasp enzyme
MVYPKMKQVASDAIRASALNIDPDRRVNNFEVFGLDFMIDENYSVWLIEINTNPCLETTCPVLNKIIPRFIENTFQYSFPHAGSA